MWTLLIISTAPIGLDEPKVTRYVEKLFHTAIECKTRMVQSNFTVYPR